MHRYCLYVAGCLTVASIAAADTVLLTNGKRMENVVARTSESGVTIRLSYGELTLPASMVRSVEKSESALARYLARSAELRADPTATAGEWLELALEARSHEMHDGFRRALLQAAALDPELPALAPLMRTLDYVHDREHGRWVAYEESSEGLARAARRESSRQARAVAEAERRRVERRRQLVETLELALLAQVAEDLTAAREAPSAPPPGAIALWPYAGPFVAAPLHHGVAAGWPDTPRNRDTLRQLSRRQPGSLLPITSRQPVPKRPAPRQPAARHRGSFERPPGD